jgi:hypothetical protein
VKFCQWPNDGIHAVADAFRTVDDPHPGVGNAWEPIPGKTTFTRDSEVQNAETAAWGRAIAACGIKTKKIASADEVRARQPEPKVSETSPVRQSKPVAVDASAPAPAASAAQDEDKLWVAPNGADMGVIDQQQRRTMFGVAKGRGLSGDDVRQIVLRGTGVASTATLQQWQFDNVMLEINQHAEVRP